MLREAPAGGDVDGDFGLAGFTSDHGSPTGWVRATQKITFDTPVETAAVKQPSTKRVAGGFATRFS